MRETLGGMRTISTDRATKQNIWHNGLCPSTQWLIYHLSLTISGSSDQRHWPPALWVPLRDWSSSIPRFRSLLDPLFQLWLGFENAIIYLLYHAFVHKHCKGLLQGIQDHLSGFTGGEANNNASRCPRPLVILQHFVSAIPGSHRGLSCLPFFSPSTPRLKLLHSILPCSQVFWWLCCSWMCQEGWWSTGCKGKLCYMV